jgi:hypothetical protein
VFFNDGCDYANSAKEANDGCRGFFLMVCHVQ